MTQPLDSAPAAGSTPITPDEQLKAERIQAMLGDAPSWQLSRDSREIQRIWRVHSLSAATALANALAAAIEHHRQHATITITPKSVQVALSTPAVNALTGKDFLVAGALELGL